MRRREFIAGLMGATAWPLVARAQQPAMPVIGYLSFGTRGKGSAAYPRSFRVSLRRATSRAATWRWNSAGQIISDGNCCRLLQNLSNAKWP